MVNKNIERGFSPCSICIEEKCGGKYTCDCKTCKVSRECNKFLRATIRITNKCTQECLHCCFASSPKSNIMMTSEMAKDVNQFCRVNGILRLNLMGGEIFCNPEWYEILQILTTEMIMTRIVTNGDLVTVKKNQEKLKLLSDSHREKIYFCISTDRFHTNNNVESAREYLESLGFIVQINPDYDAKTTNWVAPVGRAFDNGFWSGFYATFGNFCGSPDNKYSMLIDERGFVYRCGFGCMPFAEISDYLDGGFRERLKKFYQRFHKTFIANCKSCYTANLFAKEGEILTKLIRE